MALSMDEQRMLAEIERRLAAQDPGLATRLSTFKRPGPAARLRTTRGKILGSICTIALLAIIAVTVYATIPFRASGQKLTKQPTATSSSAPVKTSVAKSSAAANPSAVGNPSAAGNGMAIKTSPNTFSTAP
jgi:hypothetical protein